MNISEYKRGNMSAWIVGMAIAEMQSLFSCFPPSCYRRVAGCILRPATQSLEYTRVAGQEGR